MVEVRMPKMGDGMVEGTILRWLKHEGEQVASNETIAEIETDKANVEMPSEDAGVLSRIVVQEGQTVPVGAVIAYIGGAPAGPAPTNGAGVTAVARTSQPSSSSVPQTSNPLSALPTPQGEGPTEERVKASPLARKMAQEQGVDLAMVRGTGGGVGRVVQRDVEEYLKNRAPQPPQVLVSPAAAAAPSATASPALEGVDEDVSKMRKAIARRTVQSKQTIPHFYLVAAIEMDPAMGLLAQMNAGAESGAKITINDLIVKACAVALTRFPDVNVSWTPDDKVRRYSQVNIGVAVGTDAGLTIPVVVDCGSKTLRQISADARALINKARSGSLTPQEMSGGTFSVSNLGMFGIEEFMAIINPPESAMLAVGAAAKEVVVDDAGAFVARQRMRVTLSCDHRTVDGVLGARFLQELKRILESPFTLVA